jgi:hypothetical protein
VTEECSNILEWGREGGFGSHQAWGFGFSGRGFHTRDRCFLGLPSSRLRGCCAFGIRLLGSDFWGLAVFLVAVTLARSGAYVTGWEGFLGVGCGRMLKMELCGFSGGMRSHNLKIS